MWVLEDSVRAGSVWHCALGGDRREVETYCGKALKLHMTNAEVQEKEPSSNTCPRCRVMATRA